MTRLLVVAALLAGCLPQGSGEQEMRTRVPGTWVGKTPDGDTLTMHLAPDGTGEVNGHPGSWQIKIGRVLLSDADHMVPCDLEGDELTCHTPEGDIVMTRARPGEAPPPSPPLADEKPAQPAKPFVAEKTVPGQPFIAPASGPIAGASFTAPDGWTPEGGKVAGQAVHVLRSASGADITIGRLAGASVPGRDALNQAIATYAGGQHEMLLGPEEIEVGGQPAARAIVKQDTSEYYAAIVGGKDVIFVIVGRYPADQAEAMRPVIETVLASFRASP